jgi:hypothetical protein
MPRGGARVNSGPPPDPNALRRDRPSDVAGWTTLPAEGRTDSLGRPKPAPKWPLLPDIGLRARRNVQAAKVEQLVRLVEEALLAGLDTANLERRHDRAAEEVQVLDFQVAEQDTREKALWRELWRYPQAVVWERDKQTRAVAMFVRHQVLGELGDLDQAKEARQWSDRLGVNPAAMARNRWRIATDELGARRQERARPKPSAAPAGATSMRDRASRLAVGGGSA